MNGLCLRTLIVGALVLLMGACASRVGEPPAVGEAAPVPISLEEAGNLTYRDIGDAPVRLEDGRFEGAPFVAGAAARRVVTLADELWWEGDLDGDGAREALVLLTELAGGSGAFVHLALLGRRQEGLVVLDTALVGDRVQIRDLDVVDGEVLLDAIEHGEGDPSCCPSWITRRSWVVEGDRFQDETRAFHGRMSASRLEGRWWRLARSETPIEAEASGARLRDGARLRFEGPLVRGRSACSDFSGPLTETAPGELVLGPFRIEHRACDDDEGASDARLLAVLGDVGAFAFRMGRLLLRADGGSYSTQLEFEPLSAD
ncbi:MAG TPA: META domain-containing protein [Pseudomonadales bacterium]|nr:META domain-containing protein [Pseudomonadales bacterium]